MGPHGRRSGHREQLRHHLARALIQAGESTIAAEGRFSLGYPRKDNGEEINAVIRMSRRPLRDLRHAFQLDDYPVEGIASGEYHIWGKYETPDGFGRLQIDRGAAYGETFDVATANLRFEDHGRPSRWHRNHQEHAAG